MSNDNLDLTRVETIRFHDGCILDVVRCSVAKEIMLVCEDPNHTIVFQMNMKEVNLLLNILQTHIAKMEV